MTKLSQKRNICKILMHFQPLEGLNFQHFTPGSMPLSRSTDPLHPLTWHIPYMQEPFQSSRRKFTIGSWGALPTVQVSALGQLLWNFLTLNANMLLFGKLHTRSWISHWHWGPAKQGHIVVATLLTWSFVADTKTVSENLQKHFLCPRSTQQGCHVLPRMGNTAVHNVAATMCLHYARP